jgi:hypothetical protein
VGTQLKSQISPVVRLKGISMISSPSLELLITLKSSGVIFLSFHIIALFNL